MHRHEYEFWLRKFDLDGFSAGAWEIKKERPSPSLIARREGFRQELALSGQLEPLMR